MVNLFNKIFKKKKLPIIGTTELIVDNNGKKLSDIVGSNTIIYNYDGKHNPVIEVFDAIARFGADNIIGKKIILYNGYQISSVYIIEGFTYYHTSDVEILLTSWNGTSGNPYQTIVYTAQPDGISDEIWAKVKQSILEYLNKQEMFTVQNL